MRMEETNRTSLPRLSDRSIHLVQQFPHPLLAKNPDQIPLDILCPDLADELLPTHRIHQPIPTIPLSDSLSVE